MRVALITNIPAPYRIEAWNVVAQRLGDNFLVLFCSRIEPNRKWNIPDIKFSHQFLKENYRAKKDGITFVHNNPDVWNQLKRFNPDVVITGGFNPTMLYAYIFCVINGKKHIPISDAWEASEKNLSILHKLLRRIVYRFSAAFIACSIKGKDHFRSYGINNDSIFISHYTINNDALEKCPTFHERKYDVMFSGQFTERKNPLFFINVVKRLKEVKQGLKVLLLGDGPLKEQILNELSKEAIEFDYPGYALQEQLPGYYSSARLFIFPTAFDAWGVVANEAMAAGTPVVVTPYAGCSDELVIKNINGFVIQLDETVWAEKCLYLLRNEQKWQEFSENARQTASQFSHERAAKALIEASKHALQH